MTPVDVTIRNRNTDGTMDHETVPGWDIDIPGLAVAMSRTNPGWGVVHLPSGFVVTSLFGSPEGAIGLARALIDVDWTRSALDLFDDLNVRTAVEAATKTYRPDVVAGGLITRCEVESAS